MESNEKILEYLAEMYNVISKLRRKHERLVSKLKEGSFSQVALDNLSRYMLGFELSLVKLKIAYKKLDQEGLSYYGLVKSYNLEFESAEDALERQYGIFDTLMCGLEPYRQYTRQYTNTSKLQPIVDTSIEGAIEELFNKYKETAEHEYNKDILLLHSLQLIMSSYYAIYNHFLIRVEEILKSDMLDGRDISAIFSNALHTEEVSTNGKEWIDIKRRLPNLDQLCIVVTSGDATEKFDVFSKSLNGIALFQHQGVEKWRCATYEEISEFIRRVNR